MKTAIQNHCAATRSAMPSRLLFTGSIIMTMLLFIIAKGSFATSSLHLSLWNQGNFMVELDRIAYPTTSMFKTNDLRTGKHRIKVIQVSPGQRGVVANRILYNGFIDIPPNTLVKVTVQRNKELSIDQVRNKLKICPVKRVDNKSYQKEKRKIRCGTGLQPKQGNMFLSAFEHKALVYHLRQLPIRGRKSDIAIAYIGTKYISPQQAGEIIHLLNSQKEQSKFQKWAKDHVKLRKPSTDKTPVKKTL